MSERFIKVDDKNSKSWLIIYVSEMGNHEIYAYSKSQYHAQDIVLALNNWLQATRESKSEELF